LAFSVFITRIKNYLDLKQKKCPVFPTTFLRLRRAAKASRRLFYACAEWRKLPDNFFTLAPSGESFPTTFLRLRQAAKASRRLFYACAKRRKLPGDFFTLAPSGEGTLQ
jgi:hypothetical protein